MFGMVSRKAGLTVPGGACASATSGTITDAVSKADNAKIGRVTKCVRMITLLSPLYRQACAKRHIRSRAGGLVEAGERCGNYFLLDRILSGEANVYGLRRGWFLRGQSDGESNE